MANDFSSNVVVLDTFTSAIDVGMSAFGISDTTFKLNSIEWQTPTTIDHVAAVTDEKGRSIFSETCVTAKQSIIKYYNGHWIKGIKIAASGVGSGKIIIIYG